MNALLESTAPPETFGALVFLVSNVFIAIGYGALGSLMLAVRSRFPDALSVSTAVATALFLLTCGLTHVELILHAGPGRQVEEGLHAPLIHAVQALAVMAMIGCLVRDMLRWNSRLVTGTPSLAEALAQADLDSHG